MRQEAIKGAKRRGKPWPTTIADPKAHKRPDLVRRDFTATAPDRLWVGDLTYLRSWQGPMYLAFLIDVFSRMIVGCSSLGTCGATSSWTRCGWRSQRQPGAEVEPVAHADQGSQYTAEDYTQVLSDHYDNALSESSVDSYKTELIADRVWRTNQQVVLATVDYIGWFNHRRLHSAIEKPTVHRARTRLLAADRARARTGSGSGRPNSHRSTRRSNRGLCPVLYRAITLTDIINYATTNDPPPNPGKSTSVHYGWVPSFPLIRIDHGSGCLE